MHISIIPKLALPISFLFLATISPATAIKCYQCSSDKSDPSDSCGAYESFDANKNSLVDCAGEDAVNPGTFCYKSMEQSPRGFIWDGRWRNVVRRCAQVSNRGISWGCDWGYEENGVYWEKCYCAEDGCNASTSIFSQHMYLIMTACLAVCYFYVLRV